MQACLRFHGVTGSHTWMQLRAFCIPSLGTIWPRLLSLMHNERCELSEQDAIQMRSILLHLTAYTFKLYPCKVDVKTPQGC